MQNSRPIFTKPRRRVVPALLMVLILLAGAAGVYFVFIKEDVPEPRSDLVGSLDKCEVPKDILVKVKRGYVPGRSGDVLTVEEITAQYNTRHSTPHAYTQDVPIVLYGPGYIKKGLTPTRDVTVADLAPTFAELMGYDEWPQRAGRVLEEALVPESRRTMPPKLLFTLVWDGGGDNVLEKWPNAWPELGKLMDRGVSYENATVGSTPSITPAIHATMGTGTFPAVHGLSDTRIRVRGEMLDAFEGSSPRYLRVKTLGDLWDAANGNVPLVGMMARDNWHLGMIGHGAYLPEGDKDIAVMDELGSMGFRTSEEFYSLPDYVTLDGLEEAVAEIDQRDGEEIGRAHV